MSRDRQVGQREFRSTFSGLIASARRHLLWEERLRRWVSEKLDRLWGRRHKRQTPR